LLASHSSDIYFPYDAEVFIWRTDTWETVAVLTGLKGVTNPSWHPMHPLLATGGAQAEEIAIWEVDMQYLLKLAPSPATVQYSNAKVVLVGDSGVGKSGLGLVLSQQPYTTTESTHARHVWTFASQEITLDERRNETRDTLLWDLAGQPGYRLIHQLHLNEVSVVLVVFDARSETDPFAGVRHWERAQRQARRIQGEALPPPKKFPVPAPAARGGTTTSVARIEPP